MGVRALFDCGVSPLSLSCAGHPPSQQEQEEQEEEKKEQMQTKDEVTPHSLYNLPHLGAESLVTPSHLLKRES